MPSDEDAHVGPGHQSTSAENDAYVAARDIVVTQHIYPVGAVPPATPVSPEGSHRGSDDPWTRIARDHVAWQKAASTPGRDELQAASLAVIASLHRQHAVALNLCRDDPWLDEEFPVRMAEEVGTLLRDLPDGLLLSPAEAALLTVVPFLRATRWVVTAGRLRPGGPASGWLADPAPSGAERLGQFAHAYPRLSRAAVNDPEAAAAIGWWIFHRWLDRERVKAPDHAETMARLVGDLPADPSWNVSGLLDDVLSAQRLADTLRDMDRDLALLTDPDRKGRLAAYASTPVGRGSTQQHIRDRLVCFSLMLAAAMAIDPGSLGNLVVEHVGGMDEVVPADLLTTIRKARWYPQTGSRLALQASCQHEAVEIALRERVSEVGAILDALDRAVGTGASDLAGLAAFPNRASGDEVVAATGTGRHPAYLSPGMRFRLADDQVRELLMGENLYQDKSLAIRELYQNALDACRYRRARIQWLEHTQDLPDLRGPSWEGGIHFSHGSDKNGRAFLQCADNGIGLGEYELRQVFSQVGGRFVDLPEFLEEQADWASAGITFAPNSRFGIGVLSYFMLADTVEITTCRLDHDGVPGERLHVTIPGPGSLFRVHRLGKGRDSGTSIRLYLNDPDAAPSCVETLRRLLAIAEFRTEATDGIRQQVWEPGELSAYATAMARQSIYDGQTSSFKYNNEPPDFDNGMAASAAGDVVPAAPGVPVWWHAGMGGVLADGLWAGETLYGAFVDLRDAHAPELTVDRRSIRRYDQSVVARYLREAAPAVRKAPPARDDESIGAHTWLCGIAATDPVAATRILDELGLDSRRTWRIRGALLDPQVFGCLSSDAEDQSLWNGSRQDLSLGFPTSSFRQTELVSAWRRAAWLATTLGRPGDAPHDQAVPARPSDEVLLDLLESGQPSVTDVVRAAALLELSPYDVCERLRVLGLDAPTFPVSFAITADDVLLASRDADGDDPWLSGHHPISNPRILFHAVKLKLSPSRVAGRLLALGYDVPDASKLPPAITSDVARLLSLFPSSTREGDRLPKGALIAGAAATGLPLEAVARQLADLGFAVPEVPGISGPVSSRHARLVSVHLDGEKHWLPDDQPVPRAHLVFAAHELDWDLGLAARVLSDFGYVVPPMQGASVRVEDSDLSLIDKEPISGYYEWLPDDGEIIGHMVHTAKKQGLPVAAIAERLGRLGYPVPEIRRSPAEVTQDDLRLVTLRLNGRHPLLPDADIVPNAFIALASARLGLAVTEIASRLGDFGYQVAATRYLPDELDETDKELLNAAQDISWLGGAPESEDLRLGNMSTVNRSYLIFLAAQFGRPVREVAARFSRLGFTLDDGSLPETVDRTDIALVASANTRAFRPDADDVSLPRLIAAAAEANMTVPAVAGRLRELGYPVRVPRDDLPDRLTRTDLRLISRDLDGEGPWLDDDEAVLPDHLLGAAIELGLTVEEAAERLTRLGFLVCPVREFSSPGAYAKAIAEWLQAEEVRSGRRRAPR
ncbi:MAG TPA: hypothetical protein VHZ33_24020 [Trebonia sp.]|nr:hypothetical protein [Trebonia sp.]